MCENVLPFHILFMMYFLFCFNFIYLAIYKLLSFSLSSKDALLWGPPFIPALSSLSQPKSTDPSLRLGSTIVFVLQLSFKIVFKDNISSINLLARCSNNLKTLIDYGVVIVLGVYGSNLNKIL